MVFAVIKIENARTEKKQLNFWKAIKRALLVCF